MKKTVYKITVKLDNTQLRQLAALEVLYNLSHGSSESDYLVIVGNRRVYVDYVTKFLTELMERNLT